LVHRIARITRHDICILGRNVGDGQTARRQAFGSQGDIKRSFPIFPFGLDAGVGFDAIGTIAPWQLGLLPRDLGRLVVRFRQLFEYLAIHAASNLLIKPTSRLLFSAIFRRFGQKKKNKNKNKTKQSRSFQIWLR
jgi:hypothetical protein